MEPSVFGKVLRRLGTGRATRMSLNLKRNVISILVLCAVFMSSHLYGITASAQEQRIPRSLDNIPRPKELKPGLSQIEYKGFFSKDPDWFSDSRYVAESIRNSTTLPSGITGIKSSASTSATSYSFTGYFIPDFTGNWEFRLTADDLGLIWIGNDAVINYASQKAKPFLEANWPNKVTNTNSISLTKNKIYPLRIQYGNSGGPLEFELEYKMPGKSSWENNFTTLLWRSPELTGDCTNFGLSYTLSAELGYDNAIPAVCKKDGTDKYLRTWIRVKPEIPSLISTKLTVSGLVLEVSLGEIEVSSTFLIAPSIGYSATSNLAGKIKGSMATFTIPTAKLKNSSRLDISFVSSNNQGSTTSSKKSLPVTVASKNPTTIKPTPKKTVSTPTTTKCVKGDKSRVFAGTSCPPGWSK